MTQTTQTPVVASIDYLANQEKPAPFAEMEAVINEAGQKLFPYFSCRFDSNICHSIYFWGSFDAKETWPNGYRENSRMFAGHVFCASQWYKEHPNQYFKFERAGSLGRRINGKMIGRKDKDAQKLAEYIVKQLEKLKNANQ